MKTLRLFFLLALAAVAHGAQTIQDLSLQGMLNQLKNGAVFTVSSGATFTNTGTINGAGAFDFSSGTVTLPASVSGGGSTFQPKDATLTAVAAIVTAADKLIYSTGVDTFATTDFTSLARTLVGRTTAAQMRSDLALGGSATLNVGTSTGTVAAGDDSRITSAAQKSSNLSDLSSAATAFSNIKQAATTGATGVVQLAADGGTTASTAVQGNDSRLPNTLAAGKTGGTTQATALTSLGALFAQVSAKTDDFTVTTADRGKFFQVTQSGGASNIALPSASSAGAGFTFAAQQITDAGNTLNFGTITKAFGFEIVILISDGTTWQAFHAGPNSTVANGVQSLGLKFSSTYPGTLVWTADGFFFAGWTGGSVMAIDTQLLRLSDDSGTSADWGARTLVDSGGLVNVDWESRVFKNSWRVADPDSNQSAFMFDVSQGEGHSGYTSEETNVPRYQEWKIDMIDDATSDEIRVSMEGSVAGSGVTDDGAFFTTSYTHVGVSHAIGLLATASDAEIYFNSGHANAQIHAPPDGTGNKQINWPAYAGTVALNAAAAASATTGSMTVDLGTSVVTITPTGDCTFNASGGYAGSRCTFIVTTSGTTSRTLTFGTNFKSTSTLATGTVTAKTFTISFVCKDGTTWCETSRTTAM